MVTIGIFGREYRFCRSVKASYSDRHNRAVKLAERFESLSEKFDGMFSRGGCGETLNSRLALACKMMMYTGIRIGNEGSAEGYMTKPHPNSKEQPQFVQTYGLTTLLPQHMSIRRGKVYLNFLGKKHVDNSFVLDGKLAGQVKDMSGYISEGETLFEITSYELTKFIKKYVGRQFTPKDFRTMRANMYAWEKFEEICERELPSTKTEYNGEVKEIATYVSEKLNNTPGVCKKSYIDELLWDEFSNARPVTKRNKK